MTNIRDTFKSAVAYHRSGNLMAAEELYRQVLQQDSGHGEARHLLGVAALQGGRADEARQHIEQAIQDGPATASWYGNLGTAYCSLKSLEQGIEAYRKAIQLDAGFVDGHFNLATTLRQTGELDEAEEAFRKALDLNAKHAGSLNNLGTLLRERNRSLEAVDVLTRATVASPKSVEAFYNLGNALRDVGRTEEALQAFRKADSLRPKTPRIRAAIGIAELAEGNYSDGWREYEWRLKCDGGAVSPKCSPLWDGGPVAGKRILLFAEQGLGDTIQFIRFAKQLHEQGATVMLEAQPSLTPLLQSCPWLETVVSRGQPLPDSDVAAPLLSLPRLMSVNEDTIPTDIPYLAADEARVNSWREKVSDIDGFKVGIAWQGAKEFQDDCRRSAPLTAFQPLAMLGVQFVSLQKGFGTEQIAESAHCLPIINFEDLDRGAGAFLDTAALMQSLNLVITIDTSIAHLAGALGIPFWLGVFTGPDWRWGMNRDDSPWYPSARIFRQTKHGDWASVFEQMAKALETKLAASTSPDQSSQIRIDVSPGELFDKITILQIKSERITDAAKVANVQIELEILERARGLVTESDELGAAIIRLRRINEALWDIEDEIRRCEAQADFGNRFIELARSVYKTNDERSAVKRAINQMLGSRLQEEKSYKDVRDAT